MYNKDNCLRTYYVFSPQYFLIYFCFIYADCYRINPRQSRYSEECFLASVMSTFCPHVDSSVAFKTMCHHKMKFRESYKYEKNDEEGKEDPFRRLMKLRRRMVGEVLPKKKRKSGMNSTRA